MNGDDFIKAITALGVGMGAMVYGWQRYQVSKNKDDTTVASEKAQTAQYKLLEDSINSNKNELIELRAAFLILDRKLHVQQRTITRMEMLLRQYAGLISQHGITVPKYMQDELEALIESDAERTITPEPRAFP